ncbi:hypothetical protein [Amorphus sp. 3PC139-8]|uniref:hypothetical protein n=1 Tax=Amorphus sp. 3PC139-8 TaxID=2735676 RepID=UPI00345DC47F
MLRTTLQACCAALVLAVLVLGPLVLFAGAERFSRDPGMLSDRMPCGMTGLDCTDRQMLAKAQMRQ